MRVRLLESPDVVTPQAFVKMVGAVSYKPGWKLDARLDGPKLLAEVHVGYETTDVRGSGKIPLIASEALSWWELESIGETQAMEWLEALIRSMEHHEIDEWLKLRGRRVREPHPHGT